MIAERIPAVKLLSLQDKWLLANELWEEVEEHQQELPTSPEIMAVVEQRFAEYERDPSTAMSLEEFKRQFRLGVIKSGNGGQAARLASQNASHRELERRTRSCARAWALGGFHALPVCLRRAWSTCLWPLSMRPEPMGRSFARAAW